MAPARGRKGGLDLRAALIILGGLVAYAPSLRGGWLWDDAQQVALNVSLRSFAGLREIWSGQAGPDYLPVKDTLQWIEWHLWGGSVAGYHIVNLGFHLLNAFLLWRVLERLGLKRGWLGGLIFAVHPLAVESVAWISELKNTLSLSLLLLATLAWMRWDERPVLPGEAGAGGALGLVGRVGRQYAWSLGAFLLSMLSKSSVAMFPCCLVLLAWWRRHRLRRADWFMWSPFFAVSGALGALTVVLQHGRAVEASSMPLHLGGAAERITAAGLAAAFYLRQSVFPIRLLPIYPRWNVETSSVVQLLPWVGFIASGALLWRRRNTWGRHAILGFGWFALNLIPVLGFVPMAYLRISRVADHLAYVPLVGIVGLAAAALDRVLELQSAGSWTFTPRSLLTSAAAALATILALQARLHAAHFCDEAHLWTYVLRHNPNAWEAHKNLCRVLLQEGKTAEAIAEGEAAVRLKCDYADAHNNLANALQAAGRVAGATLHYQAAVRLESGNAAFHCNLGNALYQTGHKRPAMEQYEAALRLNPHCAAANYNLGTALLLDGRARRAARYLRAAVADMPDDAHAHDNLGSALLVIGKFDEAVGQFHEALHLAPTDPSASRNLEKALSLLPAPQH